MNTSTLIKIMAGLMPFAPVTTDIVDLDLNIVTDTEETAEETQEGPTMADEIAAHNSNIPIILGAESLNVQIGDSFDPLAGVYAIDSQDGDITGQIEVTSDSVDTSSAGTYTVSYRVENSSGSYYNYTRSITVSDAPSDPIPAIPVTGSPSEDESGDNDESGSTSSDGATSAVVLFRGLEDTTIAVGSDFDPKEGVTVLDTDGTNITNEIYISGDVDTSSPGEYNIAYAVFDIFGDPHAEARTVVVE